MAKDWSAPTAPIPVQNRVNRFGDVLIAAALILITAPLMALVYLAIKLESGGPVVYKIPHRGPGGDSVLLLNFRTSTQPTSGAIWWSGERETRVGQFLRYTRIEQLPQLFDLLRGDMTMLGLRD